MFRFEFFFASFLCTAIQHADEIAFFLLIFRSVEWPLRCEFHAKFRRFIVCQAVIGKRLMTTHFFASNVFNTLLL